MKPEIWSIVLAAGKSTRMQKQKLLLPYQGEPIIRKVANTAMHATNGNVLVVLGSHRDEIREQAGSGELKFCYNPNYESGMLSSVICGFNAVPDDALAVMLFLGDQPQIPVTVPFRIIEAWKSSRKGIVIPTFTGKRGHPVLIETKYKNEIENLDPQTGLRGLMEKFKEDIFEIECEAAEITRDIDTPADYINEINKIK